MNDESGGADTNSPASNSQIARVGRGVEKIKRYFQNRQAEKQKESSQDRASRRTADATVAIAALTVAVVVVGCLQYLIFKSQLKVMSDQLIEMKGTGTQTDALIEANKKLAEAAKVSADAANIGNRAWLSPRYFSTVGPIREGQKISIHVIYENSGKTPATEISLRVSPRTLSSNNGFPIPPNLYNNVRMGENKSCENKDVISYEGVSYPASAVAGTESNFDTDNVNLTAKIMSRTVVIIFQGCYTYKTLNDWHHSLFCQYLAPAEDKPAEQWKFGACADGNSAD